MRDPDVSEYIEATESEDLRRINADLQNRLRRLRTEKEDLVKATFEGARDALLALGPVSPVEPPKPDKRNGRGEVALWHLTDWQGSKALDDETPVLTPEGWIRHGDIRPGDEVYGPEGHPVKVLAVTGSSLQECYRLTFDSGTEIVASGNHLWQGWRRYKDPSTNEYSRRSLLWTTAKIATLEPTERDGRTYIERAFHVDLCEPIDGPFVYLPIDPYLLGVWLGDGSKNAGHFACGEEDIDAMRYLGNPVTYREGSVWIVRVPGLRAALRHAGILGNKHIPGNYLFASPAQRLSLLQGLMDSDGTCREQGRAVFSNTNQNLADGVAWLATSLGCKVYRSDRQGKLNGEEKRRVHQVAFRPTFPAFRLPRKIARQAEVEEGHQSRYRFVQSVEPVGERSAQCLRVEGGLYLAGRDLVVTHNCTPTYNSEVMRQRVLRYCDKAEKLTNIQRAAHPVNECVIAFGGDQVEGLFNYPSQPFEVDASLFGQFAFVARLEADVVRRALGIYDRVTVVSEWGNHGRVGSKRAAVPRSDNVDRMASMLAQEIVGENERLVSWSLEDEDIQRIEIGNYRALLIHGDEIGRGGQVSINTVINHAKGWKSGAYDWDFLDIYAGHFHSHRDIELPWGGCYFQTGSPETDNRYARDSMASSSKPSQRLHFIDPVKGRVTAQYRVDLRD